MSRPDLQAPFSLSKGVVATLALLALAGCAVGPDYKRPDNTLPDSYNQATAKSEPATSAEAPAPVQKEWWLLFQDPALNELVSKALNQNFDLQAAVGRVEEAGWKKPKGWPGRPVPPSSRKST
jgi:multidrug efflux system outer membrane protein